MRSATRTLLLVTLGLVAACRPRDELPKDVTLPASSSATIATEHGVKIVLSRSQLSMEGIPLALVPSAAAFGTRGFDAQYKRDGREESLLLAPLASALDAVRGAVDAGLDEATIYLDGTTPYRPFTEVLYTLGRAGVTTTHVAVASGTKRATIDVRAPTSAEIAAAHPSSTWSPLGPLAKKEPPRVVNVVLASDGTHVKMPADDCIAAPGDVAALTACTKRAKANPSFAGVEIFVLTAAPATPMQDVVVAIDVVSSDFPRVSFGLAER